MEQLSVRVSQQSCYVSLISDVTFDLFHSANLIPADPGGSRLLPLLQTDFREEAASGASDNDSGSEHADPLSRDAGTTG